MEFLCGCWNHSGYWQEIDWKRKLLARSPSLLAAAEKSGEVVHSLDQHITSSLKLQLQRAWAAGPNGTNLKGQRFLALTLKNSGFEMVLVSQKANTVSGPSGVYIGAAWTPSTWEGSRRGSVPWGEVRFLGRERAEGGVPWKSQACGRV